MTKYTHCYCAKCNKKLPELTIDHINRIRDDGRICNLRETNYSTQNKNRNF